ncbi:MAG TPA: hypothetical protein VGL63_01945 [Streptosporangiaceae bacterium]|jgi:GH24 family phage-related lysozyme (muramidase)
MYQSVKNVFNSFTGRFEGRVHWMYVDVKGLITTGVGNLIDPVSMAVVLPFQHANGAAATQAEITAAWTDLKNNSIALGKAGYQACASHNDLRLSDPAIDNLVSSKLASNEITFLRSFPAFATWPADAQLAGMSMCWALGPAFASQWPKLAAALNAKDWATAAANCSISTTGNPGVAPRNTADIALFNNAAAVAKNGADPSVVYYPGSVPASSAVGPGSGSPGSTSGAPSGSGSGTSGSSPSGSSGSSTSKSSTPGNTASSPTSSSSSSGSDPSDGSTDSTDPSSDDTGTGSTADGAGSDSTDSTGDTSDGTDSGDGSADGGAPVLTVRPMAATVRPEAVPRPMAAMARLTAATALTAAATRRTAAATPVPTAPTRRATLPMAAATRPAAAAPAAPTRRATLPMAAATRPAAAAPATAVARPMAAATRAMEAVPQRIAAAMVPNLAGPPWPAAAPPAEGGESALCFPSVGCKPHIDPHGLAGVASVALVQPGAGDGG